MNTKRDFLTREIDKQVETVTLQMKHLHYEISVLMPLIKNLEEKEKDDVSKKLTFEGSALLQALVSLKS
ncbi:MerR family transcriptional regulator [Cytobacillus purgationiresistens]|uniref:Uncharacterized protein n=1 Tax=Cytobacillus purgationiresistens TaxID=863449 RepID=A0ABU0ADV5_9BACI|nr:MerR family transcriptional regulator [Cytobacillus purgationiresistens]MDQ0268987.1 hypothetical protein [Cytobacillus purgationiresistens]